MNSWSYSGPYIPGVLSYYENWAIKYHGESNSSYDTDVLEGEINVVYKSGEDGDILDKDRNVDGAALAESPYVHLSTCQFTKYIITKTSELDFHQRGWKVKCEMFLFSDGKSDKLSIEELSDIPICCRLWLLVKFTNVQACPDPQRIHILKLLFF